MRVKGSALALAYLLAIGCAAGGLMRPAKRRNPAPVGTAATVLQQAGELLNLVTPRLVYDMNNAAEERPLMIADLWTDALLSIGNRFSDANMPLVHLLQEQTLDESDEPVRFRQLQGQSRFESVISTLFRARSQRFVGIENAAIAVMWLYYRVPGPVWQTFTYFSRAVMSKTWAEQLCDTAAESDPGPSYPVAKGITAAVFDNLMMRVNYKAFAVAGETGTQIEMTNWATVFLPALAMPSGFRGIDAILSDGGIFKAF